MIMLENYEFFVDEKQSKSGNTYVALFMRLGEKNLLIKFLTRGEYDYIKNLSK